MDEPAKTIRERVVKVMCEVYDEHEPDEISDPQSLGDLGFDDFDVVDLNFALEDEFEGIVIDDDEATKGTTVGDLVTLVGNKCAALLCIPATS